MAKSAKELAILAEDTRYVATDIKYDVALKTVKLSEELKLKERAVENQERFVRSITNFFDVIIREGLK